MPLTKEDYMRLPKERLVELLIEKDTEERQHKNSESLTEPNTHRPFITYVDGRWSKCPYTGNFCTFNFNCNKCACAGKSIVTSSPSPFSEELKPNQ